MSKENKEPAKMGAPIYWTDELKAKAIDHIIELMYEGNSLTRIIKKKPGCETDMRLPTFSNWSKWLASDPELEKRYAHANLSRADVYFDEMHEIADNMAYTKTKIKRTGATDANNWEQVETKLSIEAAKVQIDVRKFTCARLNPAKYGVKPVDSVETKHEEQPLFEDLGN